MSIIFNPSTIRISVNGQKREVYRKQTVLQSLLQIDEIFQHNCHKSSLISSKNQCYDCTVKLDQHRQTRKFKVCLAPVEEGMNLIIS
jgi:predicted molibdopterin-dependent oxidoreductase YjgC